MSFLEIIGVIATYLVIWIGGGYIATILFAWWLNTTEWAKTAELAFFGPVYLFGLGWLILIGVGGLISVVWIIARSFS